MGYLLKKKRTQRLFVHKQVVCFDSLVAFFVAFFALRLICCLFVCVDLTFEGRCFKEQFFLNAKNLFFLQCICMSLLSLTNRDGQLGISYLSDGVMTSTNGAVSETSQITEDISTINGEITSINEDMSTINGEITSINEDMSTINGEITTINGEITTINGEITTINGEITTINGEITTINGEITTINEEIAQLSGGGTSLDSVAPMATDVAATLYPRALSQWSALSGSSNSTNIISMACSGDGKCAFVCSWSIGYPQISTNYGSTWTTLNTLSTNIWSCAINLDGQYIAYSDVSGNYYISTNFGASFSSPSNRPTTVMGVSMSATGKVIACGCSTTGLTTSSDYGATWTTRAAGTIPWGVTATSLDGSAIYAGSGVNIGLSYIYKSVDQGITWTQVYSTGTGAIRRLRCSGDGKYVLAAIDASTSLVLSTDYGATFNAIPGIALGTGNYYSIDMSSNGMYMMATVSGTSLSFSTNYGNAWTTLSNSAFTYACISANGSVAYNASPYQRVLRSIFTNVIFQTAQPTIAVAGSAYFNTTNGVLSIYDGTNWITINTLA